MSDFGFRYNQLDGENTKRIVGFEVSARSVDISGISEGQDETCLADLSKAKQQIVTKHTKEIKFSYDVVWEVIVIC